MLLHLVSVFDSMIWCCCCGVAVSMDAARYRISGRVLNLAELQTRCVQGDDQAWKELYAELFPLARYIGSQAPFEFDAGTAAEIAQEVMLELTRKLAEIKNVGAFTRRIAHNKCVDRVRKKKETPLAALRNDEDVSSDLLDSLQAPDYLPESLDDSRVIRAFQAALAGLGEPCSQLLQCRFFDELTYAEVARRIGMPAGQIGVRIGRCLAKLREKMQSEPAVWKELEMLMVAGA